MLRAAVRAATPVGLKVKHIMERGDLCPDEIVVEAVADRISQPDAHNGFILDGFPRTVHQAEALDRMLEEKHLELDAVIELKVDEDSLLHRIEKRVAEMTARGEAAARRRQCRGAQEAARCLSPAHRAADRLLLRQGHAAHHRRHGSDRGGDEGAHRRARGGCRARMHATAIKPARGAPGR